MTAHFINSGDRLNLHCVLWMQKHFASELVKENKVHEGI